MGSVSLSYGPDGKRIRRKVLGKTKQEVRDRLKALHKEMDAGVKSSKTYTVREAVKDWLREGLVVRSERTRTLYEGLLGPLLDAIGARPLRVLSAGDVRSGLGKLTDRGRARTGTRPTAGALSGMAAIPRPKNSGGPWRCRTGAWKRSVSTWSSRRGTGCRLASCGRSTAWSSPPGSARRCPRTT